MEDEETFDNSYYYKERSKIRTWYGKTFLIVTSYTLWWLTFYYLWLFIPNENDQLTPNFIDISAWFSFLVAGPFCSFLIAKKIIKNCNIKPLLMYIIASIFILIGFILFYVLAVIEALKHWSGFI